MIAKMLGWAGSNRADGRGPGEPGTPEPVQDPGCASDQVFHRAKAVSINFNEPFARLFEDGVADESLAPRGGDPAEAAELLLTRPAGPMSICAAATAGRPNAPGTARAD